jgi:hypothetical protein
MKKQLEQEKRQQNHSLEVRVLPQLCPSSLRRPDQLQLSLDWMLVLALVKNH